jgi:hypothetical protein
MLLYLLLSNGEFFKGAGVILDDLGPSIKHVERAQETPLNRTSKYFTHAKHDDDGNPDVLKLNCNP